MERPYVKMGRISFSLLNHIHQQLTTTNSDLIVFNNRIVNAALFNSEYEGLYGNLIHRKPDLVVIGKSEMKVFVVEISTPFDAFINQCYQTKFDYYLPLRELINVDTLYTCKTVVIIIGATGCVHNKVIADHGNRN